jgi:hypothetical protein
MSFCKTLICYVELKKLIFPVQCFAECILSIAVELQTKYGVIDN